MLNTIYKNLKSASKARCKVLVDEVQKASRETIPAHLQGWNAKLRLCEVTASSMTNAVSENNDHSDLVKVERIHPKTGVVLGGFYKE
jgi:hypothetical protein